MCSTDNPAVVYKKKGAIGYITINRPEEHNAVSPEVLCRLADYLQDYLGDSTLRVAIISGPGDKAFCAGQTWVDSSPCWQEPDAQKIP
jgi:enoyl-CoA hydratase/carnithine racemase